MNAIIDFLAGRRNKLLRDILATSFAISIFSMMVASYVTTMVDTMHVSRQPMPPKAVAAAKEPSSGRMTTVTRSVLDDSLITGSVPGQTIVLDPCTGREKK